MFLIVERSISREELGFTVAMVLRRCIVTPVMDTLVAGLPEGSPTSRTPPDCAMTTLPALVLGHIPTGFTKPIALAHVLPPDSVVLLPTMSTLSSARTRNGSCGPESPKQPANETNWSAGSTIWSSPGDAFACATAHAKLPTGSGWPCPPHAPTSVTV